MTTATTAAITVSVPTAPQATHTLLVHCLQEAGIALVATPVATASADNTTTLKAARVPAAQE
jgi:hypothetical protein